METLEKLKTTLVALEEHLRGRKYLAGEFSLANIAYADNFVRLRELSEKSEIGLAEYPNVMAWMERVEARES